jgi:hypothetical protein
MAEDAPTQQWSNPASPPTKAPRSPARRRVEIAGAAAALAAIVGVATVGSSRHPASSPIPATSSSAAPTSAPTPTAALVVHNRLVEPIVVTVEDSGLTVGPQRDVRIPVQSGAPLEAHWAMVRPSHQGRVLGRGIEGAIIADRVDGERRELVDASAGGVVRFTPVVINRTRRGLTVTVVDADDSVGCRCTLAPGDSLRLGYYPLGGRSLVRVTTSDGRSARYPAMLGARDSVSGAMRIPVENADLLAAKPPRKTASPRRSAPAARERPNPLGRILPVH